MRKRAFLVTAMVCIWVLEGLCSDPGAQGPDDKSGSQPPAAQGFIERYHENALKRRRFLMCYEAGKGDCYKEAEDAVTWCQNNWDRCYPLIEGASGTAGSYGAQVSKKCKQKLREKCHKEAGM
jgi:hypothetical protein